MRLTQSGTPEDERYAAMLLAYCGILFDEIYWHAYTTWRCRLYTDNPFR